MAKIDIKQAAPAAFGYPAAHMSPKYGHVDTERVIDFFGERGFEVVSAGQDKPRRRDPKTVSHLIEFQPTALAEEPKVGGCAPRILVRNSHNGRTVMRLNFGLYRFVCANGLVVGQTLMPETTVRHSRNVNFKLERYLDDFSEQAENAVSRMSAWSDITLSARQRNRLAREAARLRFGENGDKVYDIKELLTVRRDADKEDTLWNVFNRIQENTVTQKLPGTSASGVAVTSRPLTSITARVEFNKALWDLADKMAA